MLRKGEPVMVHVVFTLQKHTYQHQKYIDLNFYFSQLIEYKRI